MPQNGGSAGPIVSEFASDPEMLEIIELFVEGLPAQIETIRNACAGNDLATVATLAHQIKGAAGGYGYPMLTAAAKALEMSAKTASDLAGIRNQIDVIAGMCRCVQAGLKPQS